MIKDPYKKLVFGGVCGILAGICNIFAGSSAVGGISILIGIYLIVKAREKKEKSE